MLSTQFLKRCNELAEQGLGHVAPNPMVGGVLVYNNNIIGEGFHQKFGEAHAEVNCINSVTEENKKFISQSTLYVNLEPCCHTGKTPPCTELIIASKIPHVVIGAMDTNELVAGKGIAQLEKAGIKVEFVNDFASEKVNRRYFSFIKNKRPYIILKWAESNDGFLAPLSREKRQISNSQSQKLVHQWRSEEQTVMVGTRTALHDNPQLNVRLVEGRNPIRIVIDRNLVIPKSYHLLDKSQPTIIFNGREDSVDGNMTKVKVTFNDFILRNILTKLYEMKIESVLLEGGAELFTSFLNMNFWDEARVFVSPVKFLMGIPSPKLSINPSSSSMIAEDELKIFFPMN